MIVLDSSFALALVMPDEQRPGSLERLLEARLFAPAIWPLEVASALRHSVRRKRLLAPQVAQVCAVLEDFDIEVVAAPHSQAQRHFEAAQTYGLTPYDASYLELALLRRCALATLDADLAAAATRAGLAVLT